MLSQLVSRCFVAMLFYSLMGSHWYATLSESAMLIKTLHTHRTFWRVVATVFVSIPVLAIVAGYKARSSAAFLAIFLLVANFVLNGYWSLPYNHPERDFRKYSIYIYYIYIQYL